MIRSLSRAATAAALASAALVSCTTISNRLPAASSAPPYNPTHVKLLKNAAEHGVLFQISDAVVRDVPVRQIGEKCRKAGESQWSEKLFGVLQTMNSEAGLYDKVHIVEFKRGDQPGVEINKDLDGTSYLSVLYAKVESREPVRQMGDIPCAEQSMDLVGKDVTVIRYDWPAYESVASALRNLPARPDVERFQFDRRFLTYLADQMTVFRLTPELAFEKTPDGSPLIAQALKKYADELAANPPLPHMAYWMREISAKSKLGASVKFFGLKKDAGLARGIQVDSAGTFARKLSGASDPTYMYVSYRTENGSVSLSTLSDLNSCLGKLSDIYRSPLALMTSYDMEPESFLYPGHHCQTEETAAN